MTSSNSPTDRTDPRDHERLLREIYRDLVVCLGGIFAVHHSDIADDVIWEISRAVGGLFRQHRKQITQSEPETEVEQYRPHPAVVHLLRELQVASQ